MIYGERDKGTGKVQGFHHRALFADWLYVCVRDGFKLYAWDWSPSVGDIALLWKGVSRLGQSRHGGACSGEASHG